MMKRRMFLAAGIAGLGAGLLPRSHASADATSAADGWLTEWWSWAHAWESERDGLLAAGRLGGAMELSEPEQARAIAELTRWAEAGAGEASVEA
ncbi:MAG: hypothetical protein AAGE65_08375, partial [Planctomycetota bacterium]